VDTGAIGYTFINKALVPAIYDALCLDPWPLAKPKRIRGFNRVVRKKPITYTIYPTLQLDGYTELTLLILITDLGSYSAILGKPWMKKAGYLLDIRNDSIVWLDKLVSTPKLEVRKRPIELPTYTIPFIPKPTPSSIEVVPISSPPLKSFPTRSLKEPPKLLYRPKPEKEDTPFDMYSIRVYAFGLLARRAK